MKKPEENQNRERIRKIESAIELFKELKAENTQLFCIRDSANQAFMQDAVDGLTNLKNYIQRKDTVNERIR